MRARQKIQYRMNVAFVLITAISLVLMTITSPESAFPTMIEGVRGAIELSFKLCAIYAVWLSVLKMVEATALDKKLSKILRPVVCKIFKNESDEAYDKICVNLAANMFGMGGVATPAGIKAMSAMSDGSDRATDNMIMLFVINATSIQLIPATVIAMRAGANSQNAADIILPTLVSSGVATLLGMIICRVLSLKKDDNNAASNVAKTSCFEKAIGRARIFWGRKNKTADGAVNAGKDGAKTLASTQSSCTQKSKNGVSNTAFAHMKRLFCGFAKKGEDKKCSR